MSDYRVLSRLFTAKHLRRLAWYGWTETLAAASELLEHECAIAKDFTAGAVFEAALKTLFTKVPHRIRLQIMYLAKDDIWRVQPKHRIYVCGVACSQCQARHALGEW